MARDLFEEAGIQYGGGGGGGRDLFAEAGIQATPKPSDATRSRTYGEIAQDVGVTALKGAIGLPEAFVGLADIPTGGRVGKTLEAAGYRPGEAKEILNEWYSDPQKEANRKVQEAEGFVDTVGAMVANPSTIFHTALESTPQMLGGASLARGGMSVAPKLAPWLAGALGEGVMGAGSAASQMRQESEDGLLTGKQSLSAVGSGAGTAAMGAIGGKFADRLGLTDVDTLLAAGAKGASKQARAGFVKQIIGSGLSEGVFEELPQSIQEQMWQNYATGKPIMEGVGKAGAQGMMAGLGMGAAGGGYNAAASSVIGRNQRAAPAATDSPDAPAPAPAPAAPTPAGQFDYANYDAYRTTLESGGRADAKATTSSATGLHQFTDKTWLNTVKSAKPAWANGLSDAELLALRTDPDKSTEMVRVLDNENAARLQGAKQPVTVHNLYAAHHFGSGRAIDFAKAAPDRSMNSILSASQIRANPYLDGKTKAEAIAIWDRRAAKAGVNVDGSVAMAATPTQQEQAAPDPIADQPVHSQAEAEAETAPVTQEVATDPERVAEIDEETAALERRQKKLQEAEYGSIFDTEREAIAQELADLRRERADLFAQKLMPEPAAEVAPPAPMVAPKPTAPIQSEAAALQARQQQTGTEPVLQNRDRATKASIDQMNAIASNPDYMMAGVSRSMDTGAPVVVGALPASATLGRTETVVDGKRDRIQTQYAVVEAGDVLTSNAADGTPNADYATGQQGKVRAVAGNARSAGLIAGYERGTTGNYRSELEADAEAHGIPAEVIRGMTNPVLVRVMNAADLKQDAGDRSNIGAGARLSPAEEAANDARRVDLAAIEFDDDGMPRANSVLGFVQAMPVTERNAMLMKDGRPSKQAVDRLMAATFRAAYGSDALTELYAAAQDQEARTVMAGIARSAGAMAKLEGAGEFDIRGLVTEAAQMAINAVRSGKKLSDWSRNLDLDMSPDAAEVARFFADNIRSANRIAEGLREWAGLALEQALAVEQNEAGPGMFGDIPTLTRQQLIERLNNATDQQTDLADTGGPVAAAQDTEGRTPGRRREGSGQEDGRVDRAEVPQEAAQVAVQENDQVDGPARPDEGGGERSQEVGQKPATLDERRAAAVQDFKGAMADLADIATKHQRAAIVPESTPELMPTLVRLFDAAIRIVGTDVRQATRWVQEQLRANPATKKLVNRIEPQTYRKAASQAVAAAGEVQDGLFASTAEADAALSTYTESDLKARDAAKETAQREQDRQRQDDARRAQADAERGEFTLTGSDRAVDVAEAHGQQTMFSRARTPAQPRNLVTLHNLTVDNLLHADSTGGLPVPSLGITKVDSPFGGFGNITLIGPRGMIDPEAGVPVFDRDAYTGRFPEMNYKRPKAKAADALYEKMKPARELGGDGDAFVGQLWDVVKNDRNLNPRKLADLFDRNRAPRLLYAREVLGKTIKEPMREQYRRYPFSTDKQLLAYMRKDLQARREGAERTKEQNDQARAELSLQVMAAIQRFEDGNAAIKESGVADDFRKEMFDENGLLLMRAEGSIERDAKTVGVKVVDETKLEAAIRKVVPQNDAGYQAWVKELIDPLFEPPTITLRGREVEPTLDNLVAAMTIGQTAGAEKTMTSGTGKTAAMLGKRFKSIAEIQAARDQVVSEAAENEAKKSNEQVLSEYQSAVLPFFKYKNWKGEVDTWAGLDAAMEALADAGKRGSTDAAIRKALSKQGFTGVDQATVNLARQSIDALRNTPTNYFEAKPQRAVGLDEFRGAVVPRGTDPRALAVLAKHGIEVVEHGKGEGARDKAIATLSKRLDKAGGDVLFSRAVEGGGIEQATRAEVERWQKRLRDAESNPQAKEPSMATPAVLRVMGAKAANLTLPRTYLRAIQEKHPDVPRAVFSELPALLADPLFIIPRKDGGLRVFVDATTAKGEPIFAGISIDDSGRINTVSPLHDWNGKTGSEILGQTLENALDRQGKIYARNKEALDGSRASTAAAPAILALHRGVSHRVARSRASVITRDQVVKMIADGKKHGAPKYSVTDQRPATGTPVADVQAMTDRVAKALPNLPAVNVLQSTQDTRGELRAYLERQGAMGDAEGAFHKGELYLFADNLASIERAEHVLATHEAGHAGLAGMLGADKARVLQALLNRNDKLFRQAQAEAKRLKVPLLTAVEEVLVDMKPADLVKLDGWRKVVFRVQRWLDRSGFKTLAKQMRQWMEGRLTDQQQADMLAADLMFAAHDYLAGRGMPAGSEHEAPATVLLRRAWHGSPYTFDKFSTDHMGKGEGAQAYGWGLYFAGKRAIAEHYKRALETTTRGGLFYKGERMDSKRWNELYQSGDSAERAVFGTRMPARNVVKALEGRVSELQKDLDTRKNLSASWRSEYERRIDSLKAVLANMEQREARKNGRLYEVNIPEDDQYLLWDKPLSEQPQVVQDALRKLDMIDESVWGSYTGQQLYEGQVRDGEMFDKKSSYDAKKDTSLTMRAAGIAGIKYLDGTSRSAGDGSFNYVVFDDSDVSIEAMLSRATTPQPGAQGQQAQPATTVAGRAKARLQSLISPKLVDWWVYGFQDNLIDLKRLRAHIQALGGTVNDLNDAYQGEELYHGRVARRSAAFLENEVAPLMKELRSEGYTIQQLEQFLHARHAPEANRVLAERNPNEQMIDAKLQEARTQVRDLERQLQRARAQGTSVVALEKALELAKEQEAVWKSAEPFRGTEEERLSLSGMSDADAAAHMAGLSRRDAKRLALIAEKVDAIQKGTTDALVDYGLHDQETIDAWRDTYQHYVPLHRDEAHESAASHPIGQGFSVRGDASKRRVGSNQKVTNIFSHVVMQREAAITRGEKNHVAKQLYLMARQNPAPEWWSTDKAPRKRTVDKATGLVHTTVDPQYRTRENAVVARIAGREVAVVFNERNERAMRLARALKNLDGSDLNMVLNASAKVTRYFSAINTQYNPVFGVKNFTRDTQAVLLNMESAGLKGGRQELMESLGSAYLAIWREARGKSSKNQRWTTLWGQLRDDGGTTGYRELFAMPEDRAKALQRELDRMDKMTPAEAGRAVLKLLEDYNDSMENATRLAVYSIALDQGRSRQKAASIAKNITVNFNRKGAYTRQMGAMYAFFNAAVQGMARMVQTLKGPKGRALMLGGVGLGVANTLLGSLVMGGGDDKDDEWERIPEFIKSTSIVIPTSPTTYVAIPMPLGFNMFPNLGRIATEWAMGIGNKGGGERSLEMLGAIIDAFNPLGGGGNIPQILAPTVLDPALALLQNRDWKNQPVFQEDFNSMDPTPGHQRVKESASAFSRAAAKGINSATGGTDYMPGAWSPTPDQLDFVIGQITGGVGRESLKLMQAVGAQFTGDELPAHKVPLVGRFSGSTTGPSGGAGQFYDNIRRLNTLENELIGRNRAGEDTTSLYRENPETALIPEGKMAYNQVSRLRKDRIREREEKRDGYQDVIKSIDADIDLYMRELNRSMGSRAIREAGRAAAR